MFYNIRCHVKEDNFLLIILLLIRIKYRIVTIQKKVTKLNLSEVFVVIDFKYIIYPLKYMTRTVIIYVVFIKLLYSKNKLLKFIIKNKFQKTLQPKNR